MEVENHLFVEESDPRALFHFHCFFRSVNVRRLQDFGRRDALVLHSATIHEHPAIL